MDYRVEIFESPLAEEFRKLSGEIECDESYFGAKRVKGQTWPWCQRVKQLRCLECLKRKGRSLILKLSQMLVTAEDTDQ